MNFGNELNCKSCSKESYDMIPISRVLSKLEEHFSKNDLEGAGRLLCYWENEARLLHDDRGLLEILNEQIGYYRRIGEKEKGLTAVAEAFSLIEAQKSSDAVSSATIYLNSATTMKSFGLANEAMPYYEQARTIYEASLEADDYRLAAFYNNISSAYKDLGKIEESEEACMKALEILGNKEGFNGEIAVTLLNLAHLYYDQDPMDERAYSRAEQAYFCLKAEENAHNGSFAFFCSKCYPSFGFFGYFEYEKEIKELSEAIYEGN